MRFRTHCLGIWSRIHWTVLPHSQINKRESKKLLNSLKCNQMLGKLSVMFVRISNFYFCFFISLKCSSQWRSAMLTEWSAVTCTCDCDCGRQLGQTELIPKTFGSVKLIKPYILLLNCVIRFGATELFVQLSQKMEVCVGTSHFTTLRQNTLRANFSYVRSFSPQIVKL